MDESMVQEQGYPLVQRREPATNAPNTSAPSLNEAGKQRMGKRVKGWPQEPQPLKRVIGSSAGSVILDILATLLPLIFLGTYFSQAATLEHD